MANPHPKRPMPLWQRNRHRLYDPEYLSGTDLDAVLEDFEFTVDERREVSPKAGKIAKPPRADEG